MPYADPLLKGGGSYMVYRIIGIDASIQNVRLNTSLAIQHFKCGNVSEIFHPDGTCVASKHIIFMPSVLTKT